MQAGATCHGKRLERRWKQLKPGADGRQGCDRLSASSGMSDFRVGLNVRSCALRTFSKPTAPIIGPLGRLRRLLLPRCGGPRRAAGLPQR
jgi:hypothetical protein